MLEAIVGDGKAGKTITLWSPNVTYMKNDIVMYFKTETKQVSVEMGKREFAFILVSTKDNNSSIPNYDLVDGIPSFQKTNWTLLNPLSYLLQDLDEMKKVVKSTFGELLESHIKEMHGLIGTRDIETNLVKKDYSNLITQNRVGKYSLSTVDSTYDGSNRMKLDSNGILEYSIRYSFDEKANALSNEMVIQDRKHYHQASPIWDESDRTIFAQKYSEGDELFQVTFNTPKTNGYGLQLTNANGDLAYDTHSFINLRYGTNIFHATIEFPTPFVNDEYCVFFDTYGNGEFLFGYDKEDLERRAKLNQPTYDAIVSQPMLMNKRNNGFDVILPIHTYFNSIQKYNIGVPWKNEFILHAIGRYR